MRKSLFALTILCLAQHGMWAADDTPNLEELVHDAQNLLEQSQEAYADIAHKAETSITWYNDHDNRIENTQRAEQLIQHHRKLLEARKELITTLKNKNYGDYEQTLKDIFKKTLKGLTESYMHETRQCKKIIQKQAQSEPIFHARALPHILEKFLTENFMPFLSRQTKVTPNQATKINSIIETSDKLSNQVATLTQSISDKDVPLETIKILTTIAYADYKLLHGLFKEISGQA